MVFRILLRYLANHDQLVQKLSESYPVRRAAQLMVATFYRTKTAAEDLNLKNLQDFTPERFRSFINTFKDNIREGIEEAKGELKRRK